VFDDSAETHQKHLAPCLKKGLDIQKQHELAKQIDALYKKVSSLYSEKKYLEALQIVELILQLNPEYQSAKDAKDAIINLVDATVMENNIHQFLSKWETSLARENLEIAKKYNIGNNSRHKEWEQKIKQVEKAREQELDFQTAEHFYKTEMYQQALQIYIDLKKDGFKNSELEKRITTCQDFDPQLIQKRIKGAYDAAVSSKNNYEQTFKTYFKYENSGYLEGTNFRFMCLMMIDNGNKRLLREMGMTPNQSQNLAIKYFYKAREMGVDNRDIEFQVFTSKFNKKWKK
jgi:tetratricopeptide (TPR) repeat protein